MTDLAQANKGDCSSVLVLNRNGFSTKVETLLQKKVKSFCYFRVIVKIEDYSASSIGSFLQDTVIFRSEAAVILLHIVVQKK